MQVIIGVDLWTPYACAHKHTCIPQCNGWGEGKEREVMYRGVMTLRIPRDFGSKVKGTYLWT